MTTKECSGRKLRVEFYYYRPDHLNNKGHSINDKVEYILDVVSQQNEYLNKIKIGFLYIIFK